MKNNTYNRKSFTDIELDHLINTITGYKSLFDERTFITEKEWRANISRYLDSDSSKRFYFKIECIKGVPKCACCRNTLSIESFEYSGYNKGFRKYCQHCIETEVWKLSKNYNPITLINRGKKITESKLMFYKTEKGKLTAKRNGEKISISLKQFHKTEAGAIARKNSAKYNAQLMRSRIMSGEFTPNSNNRNTHWNAEFNNRRYRSSWEALYQYHNATAEYETLRIPYFYNGKELIYIVDFIDHVNKIVVEVKPKELLLDEKTKLKLSALYEWSVCHLYTVEIFTLDSIKVLPEPNYQLFDKSTAEKIKKIYAKIKN